MSKEMDLLKRILATGWLDHKLSCEVEELLAQPEQEQEQEPVAWRTYRVVTDDWQYHIFPYGLDLTCQPLYLAPPKREPLSDLRIRTANRNEYFEWGVRFAEKAHGITGVDYEC